MSGVIFYGWNRSVPGREQLTADHFQEFLGYLAGLQQNNAVESFEVVLLSDHGGDLNGFILIRGSNDQLNALTATDEWMMHVTRGGFHLEGSGLVRGVTGEDVMKWMNLWTEVISG